MSSIDLANYETDKSPEALALYEQQIGSLYQQRAVLLELGVQRGGSLLMWRDLMPNAQIVGLDLNPIDIHDETGRVHVYEGFQQDTAVLDRIAATHAPDGFDVIIDDASHIGEYTAASFWHLFPKLKPGGVYVLEDWSSGYWGHWPDGSAFSGSRETLGERGPAAAPGRVEHVRRRIRAAARPIAERLDSRPELKARLRELYMRAEGASITTRFRSHDYGMVGLVKQLVDACAIDVIDAPKGEGAALVQRALIESVHVTPSKVFLRRR